MKSSTKYRLEGRFPVPASRPTLSARIIRRSPMRTKPLVSRHFGAEAGHHKQIPLEREATETSLNGKRLHTRDPELRDEEAVIYRVERKEHIIPRGAVNIAPIGRENVPYEHPTVLEAAVVATPTKSSANMFWPVCC